MTSKEAIMSIKDTKTNQAKFETFGKPRAMYLVKDIRKEEIKVIEKELRRLKRLENEKEKLKQENEELNVICDKLFLEYAKYKNNIEILKSKKFRLFYKQHMIDGKEIITYHLDSPSATYTLTQDEYNLLKEVLG